MARTKTMTRNSEPSITARQLTALMVNQNAFMEAEEAYNLSVDKFIQDMQSKSYKSYKYMFSSQVAQYHESYPKYLEYKELDDKRKESVIAKDEAMYKMYNRKCTEIWKDPLLVDYTNSRKTFEKYRPDPDEEGGLLRLTPSALKSGLYDDHSKVIQPQHRLVLITIEKSFTALAQCVLQYSDKHSFFKPKILTQLISREHFGISQQIVAIFIACCVGSYQKNKVQPIEDVPGASTEEEEEKDIFESTDEEEEASLPIRSSYRKAPEAVPEPSLRPVEENNDLLSTQEAEFTDSNSGVDSESDEDFVQRPPKSVSANRKKNKSSTLKRKDSKKKSSNNKRRVHFEEASAIPSSSKEDDADILVEEIESPCDSNSENGSTNQGNNGLISDSGKQNVGSSGNHQGSEDNNQGDQNREKSGDKSSDQNNSSDPNQNQCEDGAASLVIPAPAKNNYSVILDLFLLDFLHPGKEGKTEQIFTLMIMDIGSTKCWFKHVGSKKENLFLNISKKIIEIFGDDGIPQFVSYFNSGKHFNLNRYLPSNKDGLLEFKSGLGQYQNEKDIYMFLVKLHECIFYSRKGSFYSFKNDVNTITLNHSISTCSVEMVNRKKRDFRSCVHVEFATQCRHWKDSMLRSPDGNGHLDYGNIDPRDCYGPATYRVNKEDRAWYGTATQLPPNAVSTPISAFEKYFFRPAIEVVYNSKSKMHSTINSWSHDAIVDKAKTGFADETVRTTDRCQFDFNRMLVSPCHMESCGYPPVRAPKDYSPAAQLLAPFTTTSYVPQEFVLATTLFPVGFINRDLRSCAMNSSFRLFLSMNGVLDWLKSVHSLLLDYRSQIKLDTFQLIEQYPMLTTVSHSLVLIQEIDAKKDPGDRSLQLKDLKRVFNLITAEKSGINKIDVNDFQDCSQYLNTLFDELEKESETLISKAGDHNVLSLKDYLKNRHVEYRHCMVHDDRIVEARVKDQDSWFQELKLVPNDSQQDFSITSSFDIIVDNDKQVKSMNLYDFLMLHLKNWNASNIDGKCNFVQSQALNADFGFKAKSKPLACELKVNLEYEFSSPYLILSIIRYQGNLKVKSAGSKRYDIEIKEFDIKIPGDLLITAKNVHFRFLNAVCVVGSRALGCHFVNLLCHEGKYVKLSDNKVSLLTKEEFNSLLTTRAVLVCYKRIGPPIPKTRYELTEVVAAKGTNENRLLECCEFQFSNQILPYSRNISKHLENLLKKYRLPPRRSTRSVQSTIQLEEKDSSTTTNKRNSDNTFGDKIPKKKGRNGSSVLSPNDSNKRRRLGKNLLAPNFRDVAVGSEEDPEVISIHSSSGNDDDVSVGTTYDSEDDIVLYGITIPTGFGETQYYVQSKEEAGEQPCLLCFDNTNARIGSYTYLCESCRSEVSLFTTTLVKRRKEIHATNKSGVHKISTLSKSCACCSKNLKKESDYTHQVGAFEVCEPCILAGKCRCFLCISPLGKKIIELKKKFQLCPMNNRGSIKDFITRKENTSNMCQFLLKMARTGHSAISIGGKEPKFTSLIQKDGRVLQLKEYRIAINPLLTKRSGGTAQLGPVEYMPPAFVRMYVNMVARKLHSENMLLLYRDVSKTGVPEELSLHHTVFKSGIYSAASPITTVIIVSPQPNTDKFFALFHFHIENKHLRKGSRKQNGELPTLKVSCFDPHKRNSFGKQQMKLLKNKFKSVKAVLLSTSDDFGFEASATKQLASPICFDAHNGMYVCYYLLNIVTGSKIEVYEDVHERCYEHLALAMLLDEPLFSIPKEEVKGMGDI